jgi:hypothetical protein
VGEGDFGFASRQIVLYRCYEKLIYGRKRSSDAWAGALMPSGKKQDDAIIASRNRLVM